MAAAIALATSGVAYAESTDNEKNGDSQNRDFSPQIAKRIDVTKNETQTTLVAKKTASSSSVIDISNADFLKYNASFSNDPNATFMLGSEKDFTEDIDMMKKVRGVRVIKGIVEYTPSITLSEHFKEKSVVYEETVRDVFSGNDFLLKHFQWYLSSRLNQGGSEVSGKADEATVMKIASILKNEHIGTVFTEVLDAFGPDGLRMLQVGGKSVIIHTNPKGTDDQSIAVLDLPVYDATGEILLVNAYNIDISNLPLHSLKHFVSVP